jgi:hypothetical protein
MPRLEELTRGALVKGIRPDGPVTVLDVRWYGAGAVELTPRMAAGPPATRSSIAATKRASRSSPPEDETR